MNKNKNLLSVVFGKYGSWNITCLIKEDGTTIVNQSKISVEPYKSGSLMAHAKKVVKKHCNMKRLAIADAHYYDRVDELGLTK